MQLSVRQIKAARTLIGWGQDTLSEKADVPLSTIKRIEASDRDSLPASANAAKIETALTAAGIIFISADDNGGVGVRLKQ